MSYSCKITVVKIIFFHFTLLQVFESESQGQLIVPKESNVPVIINSFYENFKGENRIKLHIRIRQFYTGISAPRIQEWINDNCEHFKRNPVFLNKDELKPVTANEPMEQLQVDLVDFSSCKSKSNRVTYSYISACLDVFSRFLFLKPLANKESSGIAQHLKTIFLQFGKPCTVQTDQGSEFKGKLFENDFEFFFVNSYNATTHLKHKPCKSNNKSFYKISFCYFR